MFSLAKTVFILVLISASSLFNLTNSTKCLALKDQKQNVKKVIIDNVSLQNQGR